MEEIRKCFYRNLVGNLEGKRPLGKTRRRWEDIIKIDLKTVNVGVDWIHMAQAKDQ
jgi:hypothetical protein